MSFRHYLPMLLLASLLGCSGNAKREPTAKEAGRQHWNAARASVLYGLGKQQYEAGNFDACRKSLDDAAVMDPKNVQIHLLSARLSIELGRLETADKELQQTRELDPKNAEADYLSGVVYQRWQKPQEALACYRRASENSPNELAYLLARAEMMVALDQRSDALELLQGRLTYFENSAPIRDAVGQLMVSEGQYADAAMVLRQASLLAPDELAIQDHLAMALYYAADYREAALVLGRLLKEQTRQKRADLHMAIGQCQLQIDRVRDARESFETAAQLQPGITGAWLGLAKAAMKLDDLKRADLSVRKAMSLEPDNAEVHLMLGYVRLRQERLDDALSAFRKASALDPTDPVSLCMSGYVLEKRDRAADAMQCYAKALKLKPDDDLAKTLMAEVNVSE